MREILSSNTLCRAIVLPEDRRAGDRNTAQRAVFWSGGRAGTQLFVLCSGGGAGRDTALCAVFWRRTGRDTALCAVFWRRAGRDTAQRLRSSSLILGFPWCFLGASVAIPHAANLLNLEVSVHTVHSTVYSIQYTVAKGGYNKLVSPRIWAGIGPKPPISFGK